jgi:VWFA-related protein
MSAVALPPQASPPRPPAPQQPTFRASADVVSVDVSVRERSRVVTGLGPSDFVVLDNGVPQAIADLSYGTLPIDVTVVLDVSVSVTGSLLDQLRWATRELMRDLRREDRLKLILFNTRVSRAVDFTTDISVVEAAIGKATAGGGTSAWDAIAVAMVSAASIDRRQLIVVFTDAADTASTTLPEDLFDIAHRTTASVASVIPAATYAATNIAGTSIVRSLRTVNTAGVEVLQKLAAETGGTQLRVSGAADLGASFRRVLDDFRSSYVLHFVPQGVERAGFHTLEVRLTDRKDVTIRARRGYYWR